jgi:hypothetical protein
MKKYFCILLLTVVAFNTYCQQLKEKEHKLPADYLKKSKKQKTTGFMLLGGGVAMFTGGVIAMEHTQSKGENEFPFVVGGLAMSVASIPFFISSASNKHKAKLYMRKDALMLNLNLKTGVVYNSIGVKIDLGKG